MKLRLAKALIVKEINFILQQIYIILFLLLLPQTKATTFQLPSLVKPQLPAEAKLAELHPYFAFHPPTPTRASRF